MAEGARLESVYRLIPIGGSNPPLSANSYLFFLRTFSIKISLYYGDSIRPLATLSWELRQVRKEATVPSDACAEVRRVGLPPLFFSSILFSRQIILLCL